MKKEKKETEWKTFSIRLPDDFVETIQDMRARVQVSPTYRGKVNVSTSMVLRLALLAGLDAIGKQYPA